MKTFAEFDLPKEILRAVDELGFEHPTEIQTGSLEALGQEDRDILGLAQTGTGKTAAFGLPLLTRIDTSQKHTQAVILSPTRELCQQIANQMELFGKYIKGLRMVAVFGGAPIQGQIRQIKKGPQIIIATPGRLIDLSKRKVVNLEEMKYLILDEADEMLNMGFKEALDEILSFATGDKFTWLYSATMPNDIRRITKQYMSDPLTISIARKDKVNRDITHFYATLTRRDKYNVLCRLVDINLDMRCLVFCKTKADTEEVSEQMRRDGYKAHMLNGDMSQAQRDKVMDKFRSGKCNLLIATDVAARGIDVDDLSHVIHYTMPDNMEAYTHRSGRTGRAGKKGISLAFVGRNDRRKIDLFERKLKIKFELFDIPKAKEVVRLKLGRWVEKQISATPQLGISDWDFENVQEELSQLSKEDLIRRLVQVDFPYVEAKKEHKSDRNGSRDRKTRDRRDRGSRSKDRGSFSKKGDRKNKGKGKNKGGLDYENEYYFNLSVGESVFSNKGHLIRVLCEKSGLTKRDFGNIDVNKRDTRIGVNSETAEVLRGMGKSFKIKGAKIRITEESH